MTNNGPALRRGLPRVPGGEPWPPAGDLSAAVGESGVPAQATAADAESPAVAQSVPAVAAAAPAVAVAAAAPAVAVAVAVAVEPTSASVEDRREPGRQSGMVRRGLPRVVGGEPWPPDVAIPDAAVQAPEAAAAPLAQAAIPGGSSGRRGLPRVEGGEPWPPAVSAVHATAALGIADDQLVTRATDVAPSVVAISMPVTTAVAAIDFSEPLPFTRTVFPGEAAVAFERERLTRTRTEVPEPQRIGPFTRLQWAGAVIVGGGALLFAAAMAVFAVRWLLSLEPMQDFLVTYPGEYELPEGAPVGIPSWLGWQHFFNVFLMVLIIRSGLQVRTETRPSVFWSPRNNPNRKISLTVWFHQSLDLLWVTNGVVFVVLLFVTGQWVKIVPTSWEVFPNAISAALQYVSLDWPTENGWVNYNSLQQLAYFATVFVAAPLAIATGVRMSGIWPQKATALNKAYPIEWARAIHFPVMLYFVVFIIAHVTLVLATGALRNLNHIYASQDVVNWAGFWIFIASIVVIVAVAVAARPLVLAPIARLFGKVSGR